MTETRRIAPADVAALPGRLPAAEGQLRQAVSTSLLGIGPSVPLDDPVDLDDLLTQAGQGLADDREDRSW